MTVVLAFEGDPCFERVYFGITSKCFHFVREDVLKLESLLYRSILIASSKNRGKFDVRNSC